jgi:tetratricopeptide (TPR) repeat protein
MERIIEERPDSVLNVLQAIDTDELVGDEEPAKHALLLSMALDKNYIDKTDFDVLQPAIDYYDDNGSATDKLRTFYYQGRIYHNRGNEAAAMESYVKAINIGENSDDILTKARLFVAQGNIYNSLLRWDNAINANLQAAEYFFQMDKIDSFVNCNLKACNGYIQNDDYDNAQRILDKCSNYIGEVSNEKLSLYYAAQLTLQIQTGDSRRILTTIDEYFVSVPDSNRNHLTIANAYIAIGENNKALDILEGRDYSSNISKERKYYATLVAIYENLHNYQLAHEANKKFYELHDAHVYSVFEQDTQFVEQKYALKLQNKQEKENKYRIIIISIILISILTVIVIYIRGRLKTKTLQQMHAEQEAERYRLLYLQMEEERDTLKNLLAQSEELAPNVKSAVGKRLELLNKFFAAFITNNSDIDRTASKEMEELLANKDTFMISTKLAFTGSHPKFIKYLEDRGLTDWEISYCCLYALGLKGKEVGSYIKMRSHYNNSSEVRQKLGINEHDTNLGIYIRKLLKSFE